MTARVLAAARRAVSRLAPEELPFFEQIADRWREHDLGAGLLSGVVLQAVSAAFDEAELTPHDGFAALGDACVRHALALDLTPDQADQLADAAVASLTDPDGD